MVLNAAVFIFFGKHMCWWFTSDPAVHAVAVAILPARPTVHSHHPPTTLHPIKATVLVLDVVFRWY